MTKFLTTYLFDNLEKSSIIKIRGERKGLYQESSLKTQNKIRDSQNHPQKLYEKRPYLPEKERIVKGQRIN